MTRRCLRQNVDASNHMQTRFFTRPSAPQFRNSHEAASTGKHSKSAAESGTGAGAAASVGLNSAKNLQQSASTASAAAAAAGRASEKALNAEQNKLDWKIFKELSGYIWPKDDRGVKIRVVTALGLLVMGKILNVQVPFFFKEIIDNLNTEFPVESTVLTVVGAVILGCEYS
jgi:ABC transporter ATM